MSTQIPLHEFYKDEDFTIYYQQVDGEIFIHCECRKWNKTVLKQLYRAFATFKQQALEQGYTRILTYIEKPKFAELFGFKSIGRHGDMELMIWHG